MDSSLKGVSSLSDAFQFRKNSKVAVETLYGPWNPVYCTTAYWYALPCQDAGSSHQVWIPAPRR